MSEDKPLRPIYSQPRAGAGGMNRLHEAAYCGDLHGVRQAIAQGIGVDTRDQGGWTPLHWVVDMGLTGGPRAAIVKALLRAGADLEARDVEGATPLHIACRAGSAALAWLLAQRGADIAARNQRGLTPLMAAAASGAVEIVADLLSRGADPDARTETGQRALDFADAEGFDDVVACLKTWPTEKADD